MSLFAAGGYPWWAFDLPFWSCVVFVLMVGVLVAFVRKPLVESMKKRQLQIVDELRRAENVRRDVERLREHQARERQRFAAEVEAMTSEGKRDAETFAGRLVDRSKEEAERIANRAKREIGLLKQRVALELWQKTADLSAGAAEKALASDLSEQDHRRLVDAALKEIVQLPGGAA